MIERYYFLFGIALVWIVFAVVQDLKKREISNWLNFSLIGFALAYRAFYASAFGEWKFFAFGLIGFGMFFALANAFYYSRIFGGGDAKLLMGLGAILPFESFWDFAFAGLGFVLLLFLTGAGYSIVYSAFIAGKNWVRFKKRLALKIENNKYLFLASFAFSALFFALMKDYPFAAYSGGIFILILPLAYFYLNAVDECMVNLTHPSKLSEGDWLERDIRIGGKVVRKSVHGLSVEDIALLRKFGKRALIKEGIPFAPVFLISFLIMVSFFLASGFHLEKLVSFLF